MELEEMVRPNILALEPYKTARDEFKGKEGIFLDANENPFGELNRYPDPYQLELKKKIALLKGLLVENIFIGNGSDEAIDALFRVFCTPGKDRIIVCPPTYGMYQVAADIHDTEVREIPLIDGFQPDVERIVKEQAKMIFLCSPNNPTGNVLENIDTILQQFKGIVIVDEAYIDFSNAVSFTKRLARYPNLVVLQTLSKAYGLAALRVGMAYGNSEVIAWMNRVKAPYNVSMLNQQAALHALAQPEVFAKQKEEILKQRAWLQQELAQVECVKKIYPSDANFLLVEVKDADGVYMKLVNSQLIVRNRSSVVRNCIRITVGTAYENQQLIKELKKV